MIKAISVFSKTIALLCLAACGSGSGSGGGAAVQMSHPRLLTLAT